MYKRAVPNGEKHSFGYWRTRGVFFLALPIFLFMLTSPHNPESSEIKPATRLIIDRAGRQVRIPETPKRIACIHGPSYEKLFAFGAAHRVAIVANVLLPWDYELNPDLERIPVMDNFVSPDVEQLLQLKTDLVIYHPFVKQIKQLSEAGLPVVVPYDGGRRQSTLEGFIRDNYEQIRFYGKLLGGEAKNIAEEYCAYVDERIQKVIAVTSRIPTANRPKVFFVCGQIQGTSRTQTRFSTAYWLVNAAGGVMQTHADPSYFVTVTTEQMILWNPDIIVVSTLPSIDSIVNDPRWQGITAVRENKVFMSPEGLFYWSHFSTESFLCILFLAKHFHPEVFSYLDVKQELTDYYTKFYHYTLTDKEAERILHHLPPESASQFGFDLRKA